MTDAKIKPEPIFAGDSMKKFVYPPEINSEEEEAYPYRGLIGFLLYLGFLYDLFHSFHMQWLN